MSMRRSGAAGVEAMSLYPLRPGQDRATRAMVDQVFAEMSVPEGETGGRPPGPRRRAARGPAPAPMGPMAHESRRSAREPPAPRRDAGLPAPYPGSTSTPPATPAPLDAFVLGFVLQGALAAVRREQRRGVLRRAARPERRLNLPSTASYRSSCFPGGNDFADEFEVRPRPIDAVGGLRSDQLSGLWTLSSGNSAWSVQIAGEPPTKARSPVARKAGPTGSLHRWS